MPRFFRKSSSKIAPSQETDTEERTHKFNVAMACEGCEGAVRRALEGTAGVRVVKTDLKSQSVTVVGTAEEAILLDVIRKTGKTASVCET